MLKIPTMTPIVASATMFSEQRQRLSKKLGAPASAVALIKGSGEVNRNWSDTNYNFRQDSYFQHLFGLETPDCIGAVELDTGKGIIFIPRLPSEYAVWMGQLPTPESIKTKTEVEEVYYADEIAKVLSDKGIKVIHMLNGTNSDSGLKPPVPTFVGIEAFTVDDTVLFDAHNDLRAHKTAAELDFLEKLNKVAAQGHVQLMQACKVGRYENQLEAVFLHYMMSAAGCKALAYGAIAATGTGPAILHYIENNRQMEDGDFALMDLGGELRCYASDITCSFPVNGKFTSEQAWIYNAVLKAHDAVIAHLKPGVSWHEMHKMAIRIIGNTLRDLGLVNGSDEELENNEVLANFMPHGLGHLIGLEVHDVGGYAPGTPARPTTNLCRRLRTARVLDEGIFITVEPGCYFNSVLLEAAFENPAVKPFLNESLLREPRWWNFGGVRIESNVAITADGCKNFTNVPRLVADIEAVMAGAEWPRS